MKKSLLIVVGCVFSVILFQAFTITRDPRFKNLQILPKDISDHDLDSIMHHFSVSLGVRCNFCHVVDEAAKKFDMASDEKPEKNIARKMMLMAIDINKGYFRDMEQQGMDHDRSMNIATHDSTGTTDKTKIHTDTTMVMDGSKYMLSSITCYTCHRGDAHPETKAPPRNEGQMPPPQKTGDKK